MQSAAAPDRPLLYKAHFSASRTFEKRSADFLLLPDRIAQWLSANGRTDHHVATYANVDHLVVVLADRTTAVLLKLAVD